MKTAIKNYIALLKVYCLNRIDSLKSIFVGKKKTDDLEQKSGSKAIGRILLGLLMVFAAIMVVALLVIMCYGYTVSAIQLGLQSELIYSILLISQSIILFVGFTSIFNELYFGNDNALLSSLPISFTTIFAAKFTIAYVNELFTSVFVSVPLMITYGVTCSINGIAVGAGFYVLAILSVFILPILPLLVACIVSFPIMYALSFIRSRTAAKSIAALLEALIFLAVYFFVNFKVSSDMDVIIGEDGEITSGAAFASLISNIAKYTAYNHNIAEALAGRNPFVNFIICLAGLLGIFAVVILLSAVFYRTALNLTIESGGKGKRKRAEKDADYRSKSLKKTFLIKEIKGLFGNAQLLISNFSSVVLIPVFTAMMLTVAPFEFADEGQQTLGTEVSALGMIMYLSSILFASTNSPALFGFSLEGKNMALLKSLPINAKDFAFSKIVACNICNVIASFACGITYMIASRYHNVIIGIVLIIALIAASVSISGIGLYRDLKNPNFKFNSYNELGKNKKTLVPILIVLGIGFVNLIGGIVLSIFSYAILSNFIVYLIFFAVSFLISFLLGIFSIKKIFDEVETRLNDAEV